MHSRANTLVIKSMRLHLSLFLIGLWTLTHANIVSALQTNTSSLKTDSQTDERLKNRAELELRISQLIEQLGSDSYAARQMAQRELQEIGLLAFDQLRAATLHSDPQIASTARYLIYSTQQIWDWPSDPVEVTQVLKGYGTISEQDRGSRIDRLLDLPDEQSLPVLCRIVRYETRGSLAKQAALGVMRGVAAKETVREANQWSEQDRERRIATILQVIGNTDTEPCNWLRDYARWLDGSPLDKPRWAARAKTERDLLSKQQISVQLQTIRALHDWVAGEFCRMGDQPAATEILLAYADVIELEEFDPRVVDVASWGMELQLFDVVRKLAKQHAAMFESNAYLGYLLAEVELRQGNLELADSIADKVLQRKPYGALPSNYEYYTLATELTKRELYRWAEKEFEKSIEGASLTERSTLLSLLSYSDLLMDGEKYGRSAEVLERLASKIREEPLYESQVRMIFPFAESSLFVVRYELCRGKDAVTREDIDEAKSAFRAGLAEDYIDVDLLIAAFELKSDREWAAEVSEQIVTQQTILRRKIEAAEKEWRAGGNRDIATTSRELSNRCNEYAWLVSQTEGDFEDALRKANLACELDEANAAYLDTKAATLWRLGRRDEAVAIQREAVAIEPESRSMQRTLEKYLNTAQ